MKFAFVLLALSSSYCNAGPTENPPIKPDVTVLPADATEIERVCTRLRDLGCKAGQPTANGATCEEYITNAVENGIDLIGDVECIEAATTCDAAEDCD